MTVTAVEEYTKGKCKIFLNDEFAFVLYKGEIRKLGIEPDRELSPEQIRDIKEGILYKRAVLRAMNLLKSRDYTEKALRIKLRDGMYTEDIVDGAAEYVKKYGYIDDRRYAENYIRGNRSSKSRKEIRMKLLEKGVSPDIIEAAFEEEGDDGENEAELIKKILRKKCRNADCEDRSCRRKILSYMYAKGFSTEKTERLLDEVLLDITS